MFPLARPRASPLWQIVDHARDDFLAGYERHHHRALGPLRPNAIAAGFTRLNCPDCGHEKLLAFTCTMRRPWRDPVLRVWGADPLQCPAARAP